MEEGSMAGWLHRNLSQEVDKFVVCEPRRNQLISSEGDKDDKIDAAKLAALLRGNYLKVVHHTSDEAWLTGREMHASKQICMVMRILVFDLELFIGGLAENERYGNSFMPITNPTKVNA